ncbi:MAG: nucleoside triphosphate pyrophosphohydrolase [Tissierellia bacterium]|nr:nucleoside triphosphate pyrophosphohydrolase [Tissierellia bacterium]
MSQIYNKLVRDKIAQKIQLNGEEPVTRILGDEEHKMMLNKKLIEEVHEYILSGEPEELADILEVVRGIGKANGLPFEELLRIMEQKREQRGGFDDKIFLIEVKNEKSL